MDIAQHLRVAFFHWGGKGMSVLETDIRGMLEYLGVQGLLGFCQGIT